MKPFDYVAATDSQHAIALLAEHGARARILAGGTDLLADLKSAPHAPGIVVDISRAADLKGIALTADGLRIGALATHGEIMRSPLVREHCPVLIEAAHTIGAVQTRNLATIGGNLMTCVPSMDSGPALVALEAEVTVRGVDGERRMPLTELFVGPRRTCLTRSELLTAVIIPQASLGKPASFLKFGLRKGQALALVNAAASLRVDSERNSFVAPRIALGAVAPTVIRAPKAEAFLAGLTITPEAMDEAGRIAASEARPISDFRASAEYRRDLVAVLVKRALGVAFERATAQVRERVS